MKSINPFTGKEIREYREHSWKEVEAIIHQVHTAWTAWRETSFAHRAVHFKKAAEVIRNRKDELARLMTAEMGKIIRESKAEVEKCALVCDFYAGHAEEFLRDQSIPTEASRSFVTFEPLGVILAVMPWNFPFWQVFRFAAPALMAGNAVLLKHSSNVPRCALAIEEVFRLAGFPENVFRTLLISSRQVDAVIENDRVKAVTITGSSNAGSKVAATAGRMLKKSVMELGGSDPFIVLTDADMEEAALTAARARCINSGQSCIAAKRFIVEDTVYSAFAERFKKAMESLVVGDPLDETVQVGPQAREDLMRELQTQVDESVANGAELILGGKPLERRGYFYPPTILAGVRPGMRAYHEELFGPVASVITVKDLDQAVEVANDTPFGLGGSVWTRDKKKGEEVATRLETGVVFVNGLVKSDPRLPFGGVKGSGYGRELSHYGIKEFVNIQTIWIR